MVEVLSKIHEYLKKYAIEWFVIIVILVFLLVAYQSSNIVIKIFLAYAFSTITYFLAKDKVDKLFDVIGLGKYSKFVYTLIMLSIALYNWLYFVVANIGFLLAYILSW